MDDREIEDKGGEGARRRKTLDEQIEELRQKKEDLAKQLGRKEARKKQTTRKVDTRRKIIHGAVVEGRAKVSRGFFEELAGAMRAAVIRPEDKALFPEYFPEYAVVPPPPAVPPQSPEEPPAGASTPPAVPLKSSEEPPPGAPPVPVPTRAGRPGPRPPGKGFGPGQKG